MAIAVGQLLVWPFLAWFDYSITRVDTDYWTVRYFWYILYILFINVIRFPAFDLIQILVADGIILSQLTTMIWYNELSLTCIIFCATPWLLNQILFISIDLIQFESEPTVKSTFVRIIGSHTSLFIMVIYTFCISFTSAIDAMTLGIQNLILPVILVPFVFNFINQFMEEHNKSLRKSNMSVWILVFTSLAIFIYS